MATVAICRRYRLSEDIALLMFTPMILKRSDRFRWVQKCKIQYDERWKQHKRRDHLFISKTTIMVNKHEKNLLYNFYFRQTAILFFYFFNFNPFLSLLSSFFPTFFVLILSYLSGTCIIVFADISGRNFLSSFEHFWAEHFSQVGGARAPTAPPLAYAPVIYATCN